MYNPEIHHRHSIRLRKFDYSGTGTYFLTICTQGRECLFGEIRDGEMFPNGAGRVVEEWWLKLPDQFPGVELDEWVVMPNHFHGIIVITDNVGAIHESPNESPENEVHENGAIRESGAIRELPLRVDDGRRRMTLPKMVGFFKMNTAKQINQMRDNAGVPVWQRNYYERIIRDDAELAAIREYIRFNPDNWAKDKENPDVP